MGSAIPSPSQQDAGELALHMAVRCADRSSLPLVDFIIQNGCVPSCPTATLDGTGASPRGAELLLALCRGMLDRVTQDGNTALHYGALYNQPNCIKLLLKGKAAFGMGMGLCVGLRGQGQRGALQAAAPIPFLQ